METLKKIFNIFKNEKIRSIVFLGCWALFIGTLIFKIVIPYEKSQNIKGDTTNNTELSGEHVDEDRLKTMKNDLLNHVFEYKYTVLIDGQKTIYRGTMFMEETIGIKENINGLEKYYVNEENIYSMKLDEKVLNSNQTKAVYNNYLSLHHVFDLIENQDFTYNEGEYNFEFDNIYVKIITGVDNISQIEIKENENVYLLEFSNVNEITALNY